jgi:polygalacturonase
MVYNVLEYGAVGDGSTNDAKAIQKAIDDCAAAGGGTVIVPGGKTYRTGTIVMKSYVELHLEMGAVLKGSDNLEDFDLFGKGSPNPKGLDVPTYKNCEYTGQPIYYFIYAKDCEYVAITGHGKIDGNEEIFYGNVTPWHIDGAFYPRMPLLYLENIEHLTIHNVTLTGSAFWTTHMIGCRDVLIEGIRIINNLRLANCDGIDPDHCQNVRIIGCHIEAADDCIVFKNTEHAMQYGACENIVVSGCTLISTSAAIKFGTESEAPFRNIIVENCNISRTNRAISLQLRDKGCIENVVFSNINIETRMFSKMHWWGEAEPIAITAVKRKNETKIGYIRDVTFNNINCHGENGILIYGDDSCNISDITFDRVSVRIKKTTDWSKKYHDLRPTIGDGILEDGMSGIYARNAKNITFNNFRLDISSELSGEVVKDINVEGCNEIIINGKRI